MNEMFGMLGDTPTEAESHAKTVMEMETALAKAELTRVQLRDPHSQLHKMTKAQFEALAPSFQWETYFAAENLSQIPVVNVTEPAYYQALEHELNPAQSETGGVSSVGI